MSVNNINNAYGQYGTGWPSVFNTQNNEVNQLADKAKKEGSILGEQSSANKNNAYGQTNTQELGNAIKIAMSALGLSSGDRVSFETLIKARDKMSEELTAEVKAGLKKFGVAEDVDFRLVSDGKGGVSVVTSHPDKAKIEQYLKENPKLVEQFNKILTLSNIEDARKSGGYDPKLVRDQIQLESMTAWFNEVGGGSSTFMGYAGANAWFGSGINTVV